MDDKDFDRIIAEQMKELRKQLGIMDDTLTDEQVIDIALEDVQRLIAQATSTRVAVASHGHFEVTWENKTRH